jgi:hypothetical protein
MLIAQCETGVFCALIGGRGPVRTLGDSALDPSTRHHPAPIIDRQQQGSSLDFLSLGAGKTKGSSTADSRMTESTAAGGGAAKAAGPNGTSDTAASSAAGIPFYEKQRQHLKELIARRRAMEKKLVRISSPRPPSPSLCERKRH